MLLLEQKSGQLHMNTILFGWDVQKAHGSHGQVATDIWPYRECVTEHIRFTIIYQGEEEYRNSLAI